ncbi:hypothetical protein [Salana multivorans]
MTELIQWEPNGTMRLSTDVDRFIESFGENAARFARPIAVLGATSIEHRRLNNQLALAMTQLHMQYEVARAEMVRRWKVQQALLDRSFSDPMRVGFWSCGPGPRGADSWIIPGVAGGADMQRRPWCSTSVR